MSNWLQNVTTTLQEEQHKLTARLDELRQETKTVEAELKKVQGAMTALGTNKPKPSKKGATAKKPSPTTADVVAVLCEALADGGTLSEDDLLAGASGRLHELGKSKVGLTLRFKQAIKDKQFTADKGGYRLATEPPT